MKVPLSANGSVYIDSELLTSWYICMIRGMCMQAFFEGVQSLRASGVKAEEIGYRLEFSKNELRKCIREYPGKEVQFRSFFVFIACCCVSECY